MAFKRQLPTKVFITKIRQSVNFKHGTANFLMRSTPHPFFSYYFTTITPILYEFTGTHACASWNLLRENQAFRLAALWIKRKKKKTTPTVARNYKRNLHVLFRNKAS